MSTKSICMVAGEASADRHAAAVIRALKDIMPRVEIFGMGGPAMAEAGMECIYGIHGFSVMGFSDVLPRIMHIRSVYRGLCDAVRERKPDVVVPVDLPDFNMRLAGNLKRSGFKVLYYIAPQAWAWRRYRARTLSRITDGLAVIFPFEEAFFSSYGVNARYVGHPFTEEMSDRAPKAVWPPSRISLMPGSRMHEIQAIMPVMLQAKRIVQRIHPHVTWHLPVAPGLERPTLESLADPDIELSAALPAADLAMVKSGTSSFEMAIKGIPEIICYRTSVLNYLLARAFVKLDHVGMPNIILGRPAVPELIQNDLTPERLAREALEIIEDEQRYLKMQQSFDEMRRMLGNASPSQGVAAWIANMAG
ncbi:MAG: Lipid-A-disaccharide synthase [Deltaproteobacteria bacterium ADurb.BinA179]|nr:MAG: Lipid-A-disaccharide synthase [Deltaproteobacteria bacterium ADurb.BinA179]HNU73845.1 lipid-A-disaccharide synthase [Deltaproteobacteria bacterium]HOD70183.1 lipid-A-disaccharide synthase [Deltaproteobacteria bacterium]HOE72403.1 lipid-A-disaccharide synthase [Deltaproteobacteria bacterium]HOS28072.1 lipid-A-disaccharide synthase [Deltaproteobacteria bacterium]